MTLEPQSDSVFWHTASQAAERLPAFSVTVSDFVAGRFGIRRGSIVLARGPSTDRTVCQQNRRHHGETAGCCPREATPELVEYQAFNRIKCGISIRVQQDCITQAPRRQVLTSSYEVVDRASVAESQYSRRSSRDCTSLPILDQEEFAAG